MYSSLAQKTVDYQVDFVDCQRLEGLIDKLSLAQEILKAIVHIARMARNTEHVQTSHAPKDRRELSTKVQINKIQAYLRTASVLQQRAERTSILVRLLYRS